ncbi:acetyltransferase [Undibacterium baiyunense]|uniref:Acetyltransferase n=1 Tax=Undibacterium baiyunense TaxID=2828731 RepID=A0A941DH94_9BURK|nr:acetyltransferase [Undibacterium baiyunense]MBR7747540.1 acetyltransferase [Undibacterium baiyunense]
MPHIMTMPANPLNHVLVIFGASNILSDLFDCAFANGLGIKKIVLHMPEPEGDRDRPLKDRIQSWAAFGVVPEIISIDAFQPEPGEMYLLGPTTPERIKIVESLEKKFTLEYTVLIHPQAYVSPLANLSPGVFIGAKSVIGPGVSLHNHVFINRGVTIGHDTEVGAYSRIQPGSNIGGLSKIGHSVTVGMGASLLERLMIGDRAFIAAGAVVTSDVASSSLMVGVPAKFKKLVSS